ncbi:MAG: carbon monoxide dehydrogenase beta subunit family protein [Nitrospinota bacterium]
MSDYEVKAGPEAFLPPAAATMGNVLPDPGEAHIGGKLVPEDEAYDKAARMILGAKVPTIFPGPLVLWKWNDHVAEKAKAIRELAKEAPMRLIPMADYRPKYPKIIQEYEINPNHPNLTIWHNKIDVCIFIGVHCHMANLSLKIIRGGTSCYTIAMCAMAGHEDAMISFRDLDVSMINKLRDKIKQLKSEGVESQAIPFNQFVMGPTGPIVP